MTKSKSIGRGKGRLVGSASATFAVCFVAACSLESDSNGPPSGPGSRGTEGLPPTAAADFDPNAKGGVGIGIGLPGQQTKLTATPIAEVVAKPGDPPPYSPDEWNKAQPYEAPTSPSGVLTAKSGQATVPVSAWVLAYAALAECGVGTSDGKDGDTANPHINQRSPIVPTWAKGKPGTRAYAAFPSPPSTCDQALAMQESLLCAADKLDALATSVGPTSWERVTKAAKTDGFPEGPWTIPPIADEDKHSLREIALHFLANVATINMTVPKGATGTETCGERFAKALADGAFAASNAQVLFGVAAAGTPAFYPPLVPVDEKSGPRIANARVQIEMHILRSAAGLALKLRDEAVDTQTAVAWGRAATLPTGSALASAWGFDDPVNPVKNSLSHVTKTEMGRLDLGSGAPDRACNGVPGSKLLASSLGSLFDFVTRDLEPHSDGQRSAVALVEGFGIVLPAAAVTGTDEATLRAALVAQVVRSGTLRRGVKPGTPEAQEGAATTLAQAVVGKMSPGDLNFALDRAFATYRAITGDPANVATIAKDNPLVPVRPDETAPEIASLNGVCLAGVSFDRVPSESVSARTAAGALAACGQAPDGISDPSLRFDDAFQGASALGTTLHRRLGILRDAARAAGFDGKTPLGQVLNGAAAETRMRAGRRVTFGPSAGTMTATLEGFDAEELPATVDDMKQGIVVVSDSPLLVECAIGLRGDCPKDALDKAITAPLTVQAFAKSGGSGLPDGGKVEATFPMGTNGVLVVRNPSLPGGKGNILAGTVGTPGGTGGSSGSGGSGGVPTYSAAPSPMPAGSPKTPPKGGEGYFCTPGFSAKTYAPVGSELTSSADAGETSWKVYVEAARQAAARADEFGQKALDQQTQTETRREAAGDALTQLCGDIGALGKFDPTTGALSGVGIDSSGHLTVTGNEALADCLGLPSPLSTTTSPVDVVFLTNDPVDAGVLTVKTALNCDATGGSAKPLCAKANPSHAGLGLAPVTLKAESMSDCSSMQKAFEGKPEALIKQFISEPVALPASFAQAAGRLRFRDEGPQPGDPDGLAWTVTIGGTSVMDSRLASGHFPGCLEPDPAAKPCDGGAVLYSSAFRPGTVHIPIVGDNCTGKHAVTSGGTTYCIDSLAGESRRLRWLVQQAMWQVGALTGSIPASMFHVAVPVQHSGTAPQPIQFYGFTTVSDMKTFFDGTTGYDANLDGIEASYLSPLRDIPPAWADGVDLTGFPPPWTYAKNVNMTTKHVFVDFEGVHKSVLSTVQIQKYLEKVMAGPPAPGEPVDTFDFDESHVFCDIASSLPRLIYGNKYADGVISQLSLGTAKSGAVSISPTTMFRNGDFPDASVDKFYGTGAVTSNLAPPSAMASGCYVSQAPGGGGWLIPWGCVKVDDPVFSSPIPQEVLIDFSRVAYFPSVCSPSSRAGQFIPHKENLGLGSRASRVAQALALTCATRAGAGAIAPDYPPPLTTDEDIARLPLWIDASATRFRQALAYLHVEYVPQRVVDDFKNGRVGTGALGGQRGAQVLEIEKSLQAIAQSWIQVEKDLRAMASAVDAANLSLQAAKIHEQAELASIAMQSIGLELQRAQALIHAVTALAKVAASVATDTVTANGGDAVDAYGAAANAAAVEYYGAQMQAKLDTLKVAANNGYANQVSQALLQLHQTTDGLTADALSSIASIRSSTAAALAATNALRETTTKARLEAAKAATYVGQIMPGPAGASLANPGDFVAVDSDGDGKDDIVPIPLNTVLRRQYDINQARYAVQQAEARRLACLARVSVEQRIGRRLDDIKTPVGDLAPSAWADSVGFAAGFNTTAALANKAFTTYETASPATKAICPKAKDTVSLNLCLDAWESVGGAVQFVGDYVQRLDAFMTLYQAQNAIHEGEDVTIISLANDILGAPVGCQSPKRNLLAYSGQLTVPPTPKAPGWRMTDCLAGECMTGYTPSLPSPPAQPLSNGVTILVLKPTPQGSGGSAGAGGMGGSGGSSGSSGAGGSGGSTAGSGDAGSGGTGTAGGLSFDPKPGTDPISVATATAAADYQLVELHAGAHTLSWWSASMNPDVITTPATSARSSFAVSVVSPDGKIVAQTQGSAGVAAVAGNPASWTWPSRSVLHVAAPQDGTYAIIFHSLASADGKLAVVAVADVQLEEAPTIQANPTPYVDRLGIDDFALQPGCTASPNDVRNAFVHSCSGLGVCAWSLVHPFSLVEGFSGSENAPPAHYSGKFARGNDNYRITSIAVNLVGTNVHQCSGASNTSSCFASGYEQYDLLHLASPVPVLTLTAAQAPFYFGLGAINSARAVAAEKYFTVPLGSADASILSQSEIEKMDLRGRPLTGAFFFGIYDSPSLAWEHLEDVQFVIKYRYFAPVVQK